MISMKADVWFTPGHADDLALRDKTVVAIDILRASTSIVTALHNGAREVIPATTVESAVKISANLAADVTLLGGERNGKMIEGFSLGNSPSDYSEERIKGKSIVFSSTNGSQALAKAKHAQDLFVCGFVNVTAVADVLREKAHDVIVVCAGNDGAFSMEDAVCAGMLLHILTESDDPSWTLTDGALAALILYKSVGKGISKMLKGTDHGRYLQEIGFGDDLRLCSAVDSLPVVPQLEGNVIKLKRDVGKKEPLSPSVPS
jgi:2-phosphosulfolactate phosphatase